MGKLSSQEKSPFHDKIRNGLYCICIVNVCIFFLFLDILPIETFENHDFILYLDSIFTGVSSRAKLAYSEFGNSEIRYKLFCYSTTVVLAMTSVAVTLQGFFCSYIKTRHKTAKSEHIKHILRFPFLSLPAVVFMIYWLYFKELNTIPSGYYKAVAIDLGLISSYTDQLIATTCINVGLYSMFVLSVVCAYIAWNHHYSKLKNRFSK